MQYSDSLGGAGNDIAGSLREAITALYTQGHLVQNPADAWLQTFRASPGSWRLCLQLLETPHLQEHECYFAANNIKAACQRHQDVLEPRMLHELLAKIAVHMQSCIHKNRWATSQQLAIAAAAVAVRATAIQPSSILQDLGSLFIPSAAAMAAAQSSEQYLQLAAAASVYGVQQPVVDSQALGLQLQQNPAVLAALLLVLSALPDAVLSKQTSVHPDRRTAVTDSLKQSISAAPVLRAAICSRNPKLITLACQGIISWCDLGCPPRGLEAHTNVFDALSTALLGRETAVLSCDAVAAMLTAVKEACSGSSSSSSNPSMQLLQQLAQQLQANVLPALAAEHHSLVGASAAAGSNAAADTAPYSAVLRSYVGPEAEVAFCRVLCAAAAAILQPVLQGAVQYQPLLEVLLQQLLLSVCVSDDGVAMIAVAFWQDCYIATLQALPLQQQAALLAQQQGVLEALAGAFVQRTQLNPAAAAAATADARDLPEEMRMVRREIASALRDISSLLGQQPMLSYVTQLVSTHYSTACRTHTAASNSTHSILVGSTALGSHGIAASVIGSPWSLSPASRTQHTSQHHSTTSTAVPGHIAPAASSGSAVVSSQPRDWVPLESALYAANVVLGRQGGEAAEAQVQQLVQCAASAVVHVGGSMKLAGTALTLLGGLATWLANHQASLPAVLTAALAALQSPDEKLSRNAATCVQRLCSCDDLAVVITQSHGQFVQQLMQEYQRRGGLSSKLAEGSDDKPTEELLLLSLCRLAVAHTTNNSDMDSILLQLVGPQLTAATDELVASLHGNWPQQQHQVPAVCGGTSYWHQKQTQTQHPAPHHQQQQPVLRSTAIKCFQALTSLVNGLPTGIGKQAIGLPVHGRHPRHQQQMLLQQQLQQANTHGSHDLAKVVGPQRCGASADDASMGSQSASEVSSSTRLHPATAAAVVPCQGHCSHTHCQAQKQQQQRTQESAAQQRQQQACFIVSQLLAAASQPVLLAMQAAAKAAGEDQVLCQLFAKQLLSAVCSFLLVAFPAAVQHELVNKSAAAAVRPAARQEDGGSCHNSQRNSQGDLSNSSSSGSALQAGVLLQQLCQLLHQLPVHLLQQICCLQLTCSAVAAAAAAGALPSQECTVGGSNQYLTLQRSVPAGAGTTSNRQQQQQELLQVLQDLTKQALGAAAAAMLQQQGSADPDHTSAALALATVSLQQCPAVLASSDLALLLSLTLTSTWTSHQTQCTAVLDWIQVLVQTAYSQQKQLSSRPECGLSECQVSISSSSGPGHMVLVALRERLESSIGPQLVLAVLLAASGAMPPDVVLPISFCLHSVWLSVGQTTFVSWLTAAVVHMAPESAPWCKQRHVAKVGFVSDMTDAACLTDTTRFKRILKNFCGGKKKGQ